MEDERDPNDAYETSAEAVHQLLSNVKLVGPILDPSCGRGAIIKGLLDGGVHKTKLGGSDKHEYTPLSDVEGLVSYGNDFLRMTNLANAMNIVMNPPFSDADAHVRHALRLIPRRNLTVQDMLANPHHRGSEPKLCVLLRLTWIAAKKRADLLEFLSKIVICGRLKMLPPDVPDKGHNGAVDFAWFIFEPYIAGATEIVRAK